MEGGGELAVEELGLAALVLEPSGEGFADFMGAVFEFLFLVFLVAGVTGGVGLLVGNEAGEGINLRPDGCGAGGEKNGVLVFPSRLVGGTNDRGVWKLDRTVGGADWGD